MKIENGPTVLMSEIRSKIKDPTNWFSYWSLLDNF